MGDWRLAMTVGEIETKVAEMEVKWTLDGEVLKNKNTVLFYLGVFSV